MPSDIVTQAVSPVCTPDSFAFDGAAVSRRSRYAPSGVGAGVGSVIGALADSLHEGRRTVYESGASVRLTPIVGLHKAGIGGAIRW